MERCLSVLQEHKFLTRYTGGFWQIPNCETRNGYNRGVIAYRVPIHTENWFGFSTIDALVKRNLVIITETNNYGEPRTVELKKES